MIKNPKIGMKVKVIDRRHCCVPDEDNRAENGVIASVSNVDSFLVKTDRDPNLSFYRCRKCVEEIK
jgi:hypothetical protein